MKNKQHPINWKGTAHLPATPQQIKSIHIAIHAMDMDDDTYRLLLSQFGKGYKSSKELNRKQASALITELEMKSGRKPALPPKPVKTQGNVTALATPSQKALIGHLIAEVNWYEHGSYEAWLKQNMGLDKVITKEQARNVIEGLKGLKGHGHAVP